MGGFNFNDRYCNSVPLESLDDVLTHLAAGDLCLLQNTDQSYPNNGRTCDN